MSHSTSSSRSISSSSTTARAVGSSSGKSWGQLTGRDLYLAIVCSPELRAERKKAIARERALNEGRLKVLSLRKIPDRSREIWHISPLLNEVSTVADDAFTFCLHPHTGQPLVVNGSCLIYDADSTHFRNVQYVNGKGSHWAKQPKIYDGEVHMACEGGTLVAIYRKGKCISSSFEALVTAPQSRQLMDLIFGQPGGPDIKRKPKRASKFSKE